MFRKHRDNLQKYCAECFKVENVGLTYSKAQPCTGIRTKAKKNCISHTNIMAPRGIDFVFSFTD